MHDDDEWKVKSALIGMFILLFYTVFQAVKTVLEVLEKNS